MRKLSPLVKKEPKVIKITDYKSYAAETGVLPTDYKLEVVEQFDKKQKMNLLIGS